MPVNAFQKKILGLLTLNRSEGSHLAGATGLNLSSKSKRFSHDLDYFHDSEASVAEAFAKDKRVLVEAGYEVETTLSQPGFIRALVSAHDGSVRVDWAHDSAWRFMPVLPLKSVGYVLHPVDLAINKILALAGRDEPRDLLDTLLVHQAVLPLGALLWAACGKDPGMNPIMLLDLLRRKGKLRPEDLRHLDTNSQLNVEVLRSEWQSALGEAVSFIDSRPAEEAGCLYVDPKSKRFVAPALGQEVHLHEATEGGILPAVEGFQANRLDWSAKDFFGL